MSIRWTRIDVLSSPAARVLPYPRPSGTTKRTYSEHAGRIETPKSIKPDTVETENAARTARRPNPVARP